MSIKKNFIISLIFASFNIYADDYQYVSIDKDAIGLNKKLKKQTYLMAENQDIAILKIKPNNRNQLSHFMHQNFHRCGGYILHDSQQEAMEAIQVEKNQSQLTHFFSSFFLKIDQHETVRTMIKDVDDRNIEQTIKSLSQFNNRYHEDQSGKEAALYIQKLWQQLGGQRNDFTVNLITHHKTQQPSVIATLKGTSDEKIILGAHFDSINPKGYDFLGRAVGSKGRKAPGEQDNASGVSSLTEVLRVLMLNQYRPEKTIEFIAYAAEEVGLIGSNEIASTYSKRDEKVMGVMQLDMTNYDFVGKDFYLVTDYTNKLHTEFLAQLIDEYLHYSWSYSECGYACSDHASWTTKKYPSVFPTVLDFKKVLRETKLNIHTEKDVIDFNNLTTSNQSGKFSELALAYLLELDR